MSTPRPRLKFPFDIKPVDRDLNEQLLRDFCGEKTGYCQVGPKRWILPAAYEKHAEYYYNLELKKDDVFVATFPRSGSTMCQDLVWIIKNNLYHEETFPSQGRLFPFLEVNTIIHDDFVRELIDLNNDPNVTPSIIALNKPFQDTIAETPSPRHIKTHLPFSLLPPYLLDECQVVYVARNPKDVAVSYFHQTNHVRIRGYVNDFPQFWKYFRNDQLVWAPYWQHVEEAWTRRHQPNLLFMYYEDMLKDMPSAVTKVAEFFGKSITEEQVNRLVDHLQIDNFRQYMAPVRSFPIKGLINEKAEQFIRKGKIGGNRKEWADRNMEKDVNQWVSENVKRIGMEGFPSVD